MVGGESHSHAGGTVIDYVGTELHLFAAATQWKAYLRDALAPFISGDVAEVGRGSARPPARSRPRPARSTGHALSPMAGCSAN